MKIKNLYLLFLSLGITSCATFSGSHPSKVDNAKKALEKKYTSFSRK